MKQHRLVRLLFLLCTVAAAGLTAPQRSAAQMTPSDSAAVLMEAAADFEGRGDFEVAAALYRLVARRFPGLPMAAEASERLSSASLARSTNSGRTELQVWSALYGLWLGVAVPGFFEADGSEAYGAGLLTGGPAGFLGGRALARSRPLSLGQARAITWGGTWGTFQGLGWAKALDLGSSNFCSDDLCSRNDESNRGVLGSMIAGGAVGVLVGTLLSRREITDGLATAVNLGSLWGTWFGLAGGVLADLEGDGLWATALMGGNLGLVTTALAGRRRNPTRSRARIVSIAGVMGGLGGAGLDLLIQPDNEKVAIAIPLATSLAGLFIGAANTRNRPDDAESPPAEDFAPGALFNVSSGTLRIGTPLPGVAHLPAAGFRSTGMSITIPLLNVRF